MKCIFCKVALTRHTKPEHILLAALGGRKKTRRVICSKCNNEFGNAIDKEIANQVVFVRSLLRLKSGDGDAPPVLRKVLAGSDAIDVFGDGTLALSKPFTTSDLGNGRHAVTIRADSPEEFARNVKHIAAKLGTSEDKIWGQIRSEGARQIVKRPGVIQQNLQLGGPVANRSIVKSCLVLWATLVGNRELRSSPYSDARQFVMSGHEEFNGARIDLDSRFLPMVDELKERFGEFFNLIYIASDEIGRVIGHFTLYNLQAWQVVLAESGAIPNRKIGLISNSLNPNTWSDAIANEITIDFDWLNSPDYYNDNFQRVRERLGAMMRYHQQISGSQNIRCIIDAVVEKYDLVDQPMNPASEVQKRMIGEISHRFAAWALGLPYDEKVSAAELGRLLKNNNKNRKHDL